LIIPRMVRIFVLRRLATAVLGRPSSPDDGLPVLATLPGSRSPHSTPSQRGTKSIRSLRRVGVVNGEAHARWRALLARIGAGLAITLVVCAVDRGCKLPTGTKPRAR
jgi:hypothetical protein